MNVVTKRALKAFWAKHPQAEAPLSNWYRTTRKAVWRSLVDVRETFPHADLVGPYTVFNVGGNKFRLIAGINYRRRAVYVKHILTHAQCDKEGWK